jgi:hypothetical protein
VVRGDHLGGVANKRRRTSSETQELVDVVMFEHCQHPLGGLTCSHACSQESAKIPESSASLSAGNAVG